MKNKAFCNQIRKHKFSIILTIIAIIASIPIAYYYNIQSQKELNELQEGQRDMLEEIDILKVQYSEEDNETYNRIIEEKFSKKPDEIERIVREFSESARDFYDFGLIHSFRGVYNEAIEYYNKSLLANPNDTDVWFAKGNAYVHLKQYDNAMISYNQALKINPSNEKILLNKGAALSKLNRYDEAIDIFDYIISIKPNISEEWSDSFLIWYNKGTTLGWQERYEVAIECFEIAIHLKPNDAMSIHNKGVTLSRLGRYEEAIECFDSALEISPNYESALISKGVALNNQGRYEDALECFDKVICKNPKNINALNKKVKTLVNMENYEDAIYYCDGNVGLLINEEGLIAKVFALYQLNKTEEALEAYNAAHELNLTDYTLMKNIGQMQLLLGKYEDAIKSFDAYISMEPNDKEVWTYKGVALAELNRFEEAIECLNRALEIDLKHSPALETKKLILDKIEA